MTENVLIKFGRVIRQIRQEKLISQEKLADICGLHRTYISDVELGKRNISLENIDKIAKSLEISIEQIFNKVGC